MDVAYDIGRDLWRTSDVAHFSYDAPIAAALLLAMNPVLQWFAIRFPSASGFIKGLPTLNDVRFQVWVLLIIGIGAFGTTVFALESGKNALGNGGCGWLVGVVSEIDVEHGSLPMPDAFSNRVSSISVGTDQLEFGFLSSVNGYRPAAAGPYALKVGDRVRVCRFGARVLRVERMLSSR